MRKSICAALITALAWGLLALLTVQRQTPRPPTGETPAETAAAEAAASELPSTEPRTDPTEGPDGQGAAPEALAGENGARSEASFDRSFRLPVLREGAVVSMDLHTYLTGVLLGEVPASFRPETLKAQAAASRTYGLYHYQNRRHGGAAVCTDPGCCQCWRDPETADPAARAAAEQAVSETDGLAVFYRGALIEAAFFSCSGGRTETAAAVWGGDLPYLQAVDSPGEETAAHFTDEVRIPVETFCRLLREEDPEVRFPEAMGGWVGEISYTPGGGVERIELGGRPFSGTGIRRIFGLRSTVFQLRLTRDEAVFTTRGFGHRVGMSQYGAEAMARAGADYIRILQHYYRDVEILPAARAFPPAA